MIMKQRTTFINNPIVMVVAVLTVLLACKVVMATKTWTVGDAINTPTITAPASGAKFGLSTTVTCTCNTPTDSDDWTEPPCASGSSPDAAIEATWSDGGAGGSWVDGDNTGPSVKYITSSTTGNVTLTVTFDDSGTTQHNDSSTSANVTIEVVDAKMIFKVSSTETSEITRAGTGSFEVVDGDGDAIDGATYANWAFAGEVAASDASNTSSTWSGTIVEEGTASCDVTFGGNTASVSKTITVNARSGWSITPSCAQDNEANWGSYPTWGTRLGENRDRTSDLGWIIKPRGTNFEDGYTTGEIASGPNKDVWYISASTFEIDHETVVNKYAKPGATGYPNPPNINWHEHNENAPQNVDADGCLQGIKNHEYRGTGGNNKGHQKFLEDEEAKAGNDARAAIEDNVAASEAALKSAAGGEVSTIDAAIYAAYVVEPAAGDNWGPATIYIYASGWQSTTYGN